MSKFKPMATCCGKPMDYYWESGTRQKHGCWHLSCKLCGKECTQ